MYSFLLCVCESAPCSYVCHMHDDGSGGGDGNGHIDQKRTLESLEPSWKCWGLNPVPLEE